jgi:hypothetical protein
MDEQKRISETASEKRKRGSPRIKDEVAEC